MLRPLRCLSLALLLALCSAPAFGQTAPTPEEAHRFLDFYYNGQGQGVVLVEARICQEVPRDGQRAYDCVGEVSADAVPTGQPLYLRMVYLVPEGDEADITVQYLRDGTARDTDTVSVAGSIRYRTWTQFTLREEGPWQFAISRTTGTGTQELRTLDVQAVANAGE